MVDGEQILLLIQDTGAPVPTCGSSIYTYLEPCREAV